MQDQSLKEKTAKQLHSIFQGSDIDSGQAFSQISHHYDALLTDSFYLSPQKCVQLLLQVYTRDPKTTHVLDLGCGTGLLGKLLKESGFNKIVGLDASEGMIKVAEEKKIYEELHLCYLGTGSFPQKLKGAFDVVVMAGVLNQNHAPPEALDDAVSSLREKAVLVFSLPDSVGEEKGYLAKVKEKEEIVKKVGSLKYENFSQEAASKQTAELLKPCSMTVYAYQRTVAE